MKRVIGLSLLFLANLVVLAHAVVPHHHHDKIIVSICNILSIDDTLNHEHKKHNHHESDDHGHTSHSLNEDCLLNELYIRSASSQNVSSDDFGVSNFYSDFPIICYVVIPLIEIQDYGELPFRQKPYVNSCHTHYITHSLGLRAPPSC